MAEQQVTLVVTAETFTPYVKGEVFTLPKEQADKVLDKASGKVRRYDAKRDGDLNEATLGRKPLVPEDAAVAEQETQS